MKRIICVAVCILMLFSLLINVYAEDISFELENNITDSAKPQYSEINNISLTFYIVNGKAYVSYSVSTKTDGIDIKINLQKQKLGFLWIDASDEKTDHSNKRYITGSYSAAVNDSGTYRIALEVKVNGETKTKESLYEYDKAKVTGDADSDGVVRANDARLILRYSAKLEKFTEKQKSLCDIDNSGSITAADARITLRLAAKLI